MVLLRDVSLYVALMALVLFTLSHLPLSGGAP